MTHYESPVDQAIREAAERGEFDNLPGAGKPIPPDVGGDEFLRRWADAEESGRAFLPMSLQLRKEAHDLPGRVSRERSEQKVRDLVADLNARISAEIRVPTGNPPLAMKLLDVEDIVDAWQQQRDRPLAAQQPAAPSTPPPARRRWWRRG